MPQEGLQKLYFNGQMDGQLLKWTGDEIIFLPEVMFMPAKHH